MSVPLSIIVASHNDPQQTVLTLASIRETAPPDVEVVIVDDCSATPLVHYIKPDEHTKLVTNRHRCGCGPSRHIGALHATGDWLLIIDSHCRFPSGWKEAWTEASRAIPLDQVFKTVLCATCVGLDAKHMDLNAPVAEYHGATLNLYGPDRVHPKNPWQVFEAVWLPNDPEPQNGQELAMVMGACYFISREWFLTLAPTRFLRTWGCDEQCISLKSWLAGGSVRLAKNVRIGHKFLIEGRERQSYGVPPGHVIWSKLFALSTLLPSGMAHDLSGRYLAVQDPREADVAKKMFRDDYLIVGQELALNAKLFTRDFYWFADHFKIPLP